MLRGGGCSGVFASMRVLRFGDFTLDLSRRVLLRAGTEVALRPQVFDVLVYLAEHHGRVIAKKELFDAVWGGAARTDDSVVQCIVDIREALADTGHRLVKTVPRRGYLFTGEVAPAPPKPAPTAGPAAQAPPPAGPAGPRLDHAPPLQWPRALIVASLVLTIFAAGGWLLWGWLRPKPPVVLTMMAMPSLAVLPIEPAGNEVDNAIAALADDIVAGLWRAPRGFKPDVRPAGRFKGTTKDLKSIGRDLGVRYLVRGSARRESGLMLVNVQLLEVESARQLWVSSFDYRLDQPGAQGRMVARIGRMLSAELLRAEVRRPLPARPEAAHYTMLARALMAEEANARTTSEAIAYLEQAIAADPLFVLALGHYARAISIASLNGWLAEHEQDAKVAKAEEAIKRALKLQPDSPGEHLVHGGVLRAKGDHEQAIVAFRHVLLLNPTFANAHAELGRSLIDVGRPEEAITEVQKAIALSPTDISLYMWYYFAGLAAVHQGDHQGALEWLRKSHQANRAHDNTFRLMAVAYADAGQEDKAGEMVREFLKMRPDATLDDWKRPNARSHPAVIAPRERIRATLQRLGVPEGKVQAAAKP
jgi:DNA-binding winged helix-turn-helix (wHTH) protein/tetratricopeptide (TPR) repeat protein